VLAFAGGYAQVAYSSCCGGHTESSSDAWGNVALPYLEGVVCSWCTASTHYRWNASLSFDTIAARAAALVPDFGRLTDVQIAARDGSGRARAFALVTDRGSTSVPGGAFRRALGSRVLPSLLITDARRSPNGASLLLEGGGLGHGVGLCQWGARGMALAGRSTSDIVALYFPGTSIASA
jgi:stage II sporulation protein D